MCFNMFQYDFTMTWIFLDILEPILYLLGRGGRNDPKRPEMRHSTLRDPSSCSCCVAWRPSAAEWPRSFGSTSVERPRRLLEPKTSSQLSRAGNRGEGLSEGRCAKENLFNLFFSPFGDSKKVLTLNLSKRVTDSLLLGVQRQHSLASFWLEMLSWVTLFLCWAVKGLHPFTVSWLPVMQWCKLLPCPCRSLNDTVWPTWHHYLTSCMLICLNGAVKINHVVCGAVV